MVDSLSCQVLYMKTVIGTMQLDNVITIQPLSQTQVGPAAVLDAVNHHLGHIHSMLHVV